jgi:hypothetical protein
LLHRARCIHLCTNASKHTCVQTRECSVLAFSLLYPNSLSFGHMCLYTFVRYSNWYIRSSGHPTSKKTANNQESFHACTTCQQGTNKSL